MTNFPSRRSIFLAFTITSQKNTFLKSQTDLFQIALTGASKKGGLKKFTRGSTFPSLVLFCPFWFVEVALLP